MLFQPPLPDSDPEPLSPSSHEDMSSSPHWSHAILEPSYRSLLSDTTQQHRPAGAGTYQAPSSSSPAYSPSSGDDDVEYIGTTTTTRQVASGSSHSLSTNSAQYGYGFYDDDEDEENDQVENDEQDELFAAAAAREIEQMEEDYNRQQQQQQQQQHAPIVEEEDDEEEEYELNTPYPLTAESYTEAVPAGEFDDNDEAQPFMVPEAAYTTRAAPFIHLEIQELRASQSHNNTGHEHQHCLTGTTLPRPRHFIFEPNTRLLLGRAPSSGLDPKARLKQLSEVGKDAGQARAENGFDDGLFANQVISKLHAAIFEKDGQLVLEDWESTHGTFVNEESVSRRVLHDLDHVRLGRPVTRRDIRYKALEFVVRIQSRDHYEHPSARAADPADLIAGVAQQVMDVDMHGVQDNSTLDYSPSGLATPQSQKTVILVDDDDFDEEEGADLLACTQIQVESLDVQELLERTPTEEKEVQEEAQYEDDAFQGIENDYEADEDEPDVEYDDDYVEEQPKNGFNDAFEQPGDDYEEEQHPESEDEFHQQQNDLLEDTVLLDDFRRQREQEGYDIESDNDDDASSLKAAEYELDDQESKGSMTDIDLTQGVDSATVRETIKDDEDLPVAGETLIKETSSTFSTTTTTTVAIATASPVDAVVEESQGNLLKRKHAALEAEDEPSVQLVKVHQEAATAKSRKTALFAAALAGVVVGSVGTVLTLANI